MTTPSVSSSSRLAAEKPVSSSIPATLATRLDLARLLPDVHGHARREGRRRPRCDPRARLAQHQGVDALDESSSSASAMNTMGPTHPRVG